MKARDTPRTVSRSRTAGPRLIASTRLTRLMKTMKNKELVRLARNSTRNIRKATERRTERCGLGGIRWSRAHRRGFWGGGRGFRTNGREPPHEPAEHHH